MTELRPDFAGWSDGRIERALAALADELVVPAGPLDVTSSPRRGPARRRVLATAAVVLVMLVGIVAAVPDTREAVADWFGLGSVRLERVVVPAEEPRQLPRLGDDVVAVDVEAAMTEAGVTLAELDAAGLGRPDEAGRPPEGGIVLVWETDSTTLWVHSVTNGPELIKRLGADDTATRVARVGDAAVLIEGEHVLATPSRELAADRVLWWIVGDREHRLESDGTGSELIAIGRALS